MSKQKMSGAIYWPNGLGYRECSASYESAHATMRAAQDALAEVSEKDPGYPALYEAYHGAVDACDQMQIDGGHLGAVVRFNKPEIAIATIANGGGARA